MTVKRKTKTSQKRHTLQILFSSRFGTTFANVAFLCLLDFSIFWHLGQNILFQQFLCHSNMAKVWHFCVFWICNVVAKVWHFCVFWIFYIMTSRSEYLLLQFLCQTCGESMAKVWQKYGISVSYKSVMCGFFVTFPWRFYVKGYSDPFIRISLSQYQYIFLSPTFSRWLQNIWAQLFPADFKLLDTVGYCWILLYTVG